MPIRWSSAGVVPTGTSTSSHKVREQGYKIAHAHFAFINPLPKNTEEVLRRYKKVIIAEQNTGMFARHLRV